MYTNAFEIDRSETTLRCDDGFDMPCFLTAPKGGGRFPGLLFIGEPFGLNEEIRRVAATIASAGYVVLAPDLTSRRPWFKCVRALMRAMKEEKGQGIEDLLAARRWLGARPEVLPERIGVIGLCMGGGFALILAKTGLFRVAAPFYGQTPQSMEGACPVIASFGDRDAMIRPHAEKLEKELVRLDVPHDVKSYPKAGHSFMTRPPNALLALIGPWMPAHAGYEPEAANDATQRVLSFLAQHI